MGGFLIFLFAGRTSSVPAPPPGLEFCAFDIEFGLGGGAFATPGFDAGAFGGSDWVSVLTDVRTMEPVMLEYGITQGNDPTYRVADTGRLSFGLNNGEWNTAGILGWYSPLHALKRNNYDFNIPTRLSFTYGGITRYKFLGSLADILPTPGVHEDRLVRVSALDLMDDYARLPMPAVPTQLAQRSDQLVTTLLNAVDASLQPRNRDVEPGLETYEIAFDTLPEESTTVREALNQICLSEFGYAYFVGDLTGGGTFRFENRHHRAANPDVLFSFDNDMVRGGLSVPGSRDDLISTLQVFVNPTRIDTAATTVLYALETTQTLVQPGETNATLFGPYRDPANPGDRIGGTAMVTPVATTDFTMNTAQDGSGTDVTANFTVTASFTASGVHWTIANNGAIAGYVTKLQCRGKGIYRFSAVIDVDVLTKYGQRPLQFEMPFQNNVNVGRDVATYLASVLKQPYARVRSVQFLANTSPAFMAAALDREPGDRITITEDVTGLDDTPFTINGVRLEIQPGSNGNALWCTWYLESATSQRYWLMGIAGASEIGVSTVFGF